MDPMVIALICAASFGVVVAISSFIRQLLLSRDKNLNDEAQRRALVLEASELEKMRVQMQSNTRFDSHHHVLGDNKDAIVYLDRKIEEILHKKMELIDRYAKVSLKESEAIVDGEVSLVRKAACDRLRQEIDGEIEFYESELKQFQERRKKLWSSHSDMQEYLLGQERSRNQHLDFIYKQHSSMLEKVYLRHIENSAQIGLQTIAAGTSSFKEIVMAPIQFLWNYFNPSSAVVAGQAARESSSRGGVGDVEIDINDADGSDDGLGNENNTTWRHPDDPESGLGLTIA